MFGAGGFGSAAELEKPHGGANRKLLDDVQDEGRTESPLGVQTVRLVRLKIVLKLILELVPAASNVDLVDARVEKDELQLVIDRLFALDLEF